MINECRHIFASGKKCQAFAVADSSFCYFHRNQRERNDAIVRPDTPFILPPVEDAHGALLAVNDVLRAMGQGRIKRAEAGTYFYGLQIAARLIVRIDQTTSIKPVRNLCYDRYGTELAEEKTICEPPEDCLYCTKRDTCDKFEDYEEEVEELIQIAQQQAEEEQQAAPETDENEREKAKAQGKEKEAEGEEQKEGEDDQEKEQILDRLHAQAGWRVNRIPTIAPHTIRPVLSPFARETTMPGLCPIQAATKKLNPFQSLCAAWVGIKNPNNPCSLDDRFSPGPGSENNP